jgi:hypothetical protein
VAAVDDPVMAAATLPILPKHVITRIAGPALHIDDGAEAALERTAAAGIEAGVVMFADRIPKTHGAPVRAELARDVIAAE